MITKLPVYKTTISPAGGSIAINTTGYYRGIVFAVSTDNVSAVAPTVTIGGVAATLATQINLAGALAYPYRWIFVAANPALGSTTIDVVPATGSSLYNEVHIEQFNGVSQTALVNVASANLAGTATTSPATLSLTTTVNDCYAFAGVFAYNGVRTFSDGTNFDLLDNTIAESYGSSISSMGAAGTTVLSLPISGSSGKAMWGLALAPAVLVPLLQSTIISNIGLRAALATSAVDYDGDATIIERGFVLSTTPTPTIANTRVVVTGTTGSLVSNLSGLTPNTLYYIRSYATNVNGTGYGAQQTFTTGNIASTELTKDIGAVEGATYAISLTLTGTLGTVTVQLGRTGTSATFTATGGTQTMQGVYSGSDGLIITRSGTFNGTIDNLLWVRVNGAGTIDWTKTTFTTVFPIQSEVFFKRIENDVFNTYRLYRYLDLLFKDFDGYVTVTLRSERNDKVFEKEKTFLVGNASTPASPFSKKRISMLCKDQAIIIGLSNANLNETFSIAQFILTGEYRASRMFKGSSIESI